MEIIKVSVSLIKRYYTETLEYEREYDHEYNCIYTNL